MGTKNFSEIVVFLCLVVIFANGCGYQIGDVIPQQSIAVPIFHNETLYRGYEFALTKAVISEIFTNTALHVVETDVADTILAGTIKTVAATTVTKDVNRVATRLDVTVAVEIEWKDRKTGKILVPKTTLAETVEAIANRGQTIDSAVSDALRRLARLIIYRMEHPYWEKTPREK